MFKGKIKICLCTFLVSVLLGAGAAVVYASSGATKYYGPIYSYAYENWAGVNSGSGVWASTYVGTQSGYGNAPAGYMGNRARLYNSSGSLKKDTGWIYNNQACGGFSELTSSYYWSGTYYSKGQTAAWEGYDYAIYLTYPSPSITY